MLKESKSMLSQRLTNLFWQLHKKDVDWGTHCTLFKIVLMYVIMKKENINVDFL